MHVNLGGSREKRGVGVGVGGLRASPSFLLDQGGSIRETLEHFQAFWPADHRRHLIENDFRLLEKNGKRKKPG